MLLGLLD